MLQFLSPGWPVGVARSRCRWRSTCGVGPRARCDWAACVFWKRCRAGCAICAGGNARCWRRGWGLLALLALLVAGPRWQARPPRGPQRWILLDPTALPDTGGSLATRLHARQTAGDETRWLAPGFPASSGTRPAPCRARSLVAAARGGRRIARRFRVDGVFARTAGGVARHASGVAPLPCRMGADARHAAGQPARARRTTAAAAVARRDFSRPRPRNGRPLSFEAALRAAAQISGRAVEIRNDQGATLRRGSGWSG